MGNGKEAQNLRVCGEKKNTRPLKHGLWSDMRGVHVDGRSRLGKWMNHLRGELIRHVGGEPTVAESILIEQIVIKTLKSHLYHVGLFKDKEFGSRDHALAIQNSIRLDLLALGLQRRAKKIIDLDAYVREKESKEEKSSSAR